ncbi:hypothetical protein [Kaistella jeonii]|uniref:Lipoprotein n=1 Tax=Kaistella jeonii TaxID=266749 RepID=A0A0C1FAM6_9FLAO|nr:hypothetical protein [Kaistella jeonii]KIA90177.1 hypothetical protein OA86_06230 [Kaistella jeonii]SFB76684.1 hypothetical protein SAMN05421876_10234 [Kaistella jeonii]VEI96469.1 Uncharacterised protein [Kaistella jeonii]
MKIFNYFLIFLLFFSCSKSEVRTNENFSALNNKSIALLIENVEKENDVNIYSGKIVEKNSDYFFISADKKINLTLDIDKLNRIKKIDPEMEIKVPSLKGYQYFLWLTLGNVPKDNKESLKDTGINWEK